MPDPATGIVAGTSLLGAGMSAEEIVADHPELESEDIRACLNFARLSVSGEALRPTG